MLEWLRLRRHAIGEGDLSGYLDGELAAARMTRVEEHLRGCSACRGRLEELRALKQTLRSLPQAPAPRSFVLTPVQARQPTRLQPAYAAARIYPALRNAAAAAAVLFFALVGADVFISATGPGPAPEEGAVVLQGGAPSLEEGEVLRETEGESADEQKELAPAPAVEATPPAADLQGAEPTAGGPYAERQAMTQESEAVEEEDGRDWLRVLEGVLGGAAIALVIGAFFLRRRRLA